MFARAVCLALGLSSTVECLTGEASDVVAVSIAEELKGLQADVESSARKAGSRGEGEIEQNRQRLRSFVMRHASLDAGELSTEELLALLSASEMVSEPRLGLKWSTELVRRAPDLDAAVFGHFRCLINAGQMDEAESFAAKATEGAVVNSPRQSVYGLLGSIYRARGENAKAVQFTHRWIAYLLADLPTNPTLYQTLPRHFDRLTEVEAQSKADPRQWRNHRGQVRAHLNRIDNLPTREVRPADAVAKIGLNRLLWQINQRLDEDSSDDQFREWFTAATSSIQAELWSPMLADELGQLLTAIERSSSLVEHIEWLPAAADRAIESLRRVPSRQAPTEELVQRLKVVQRIASSQKSR